MTSLSCMLHSLHLTLCLSIMGWALQAQDTPSPLAPVETNMQEAETNAEASTPLDPLKLPTLDLLLPPGRHLRLNQRVFDRAGLLTPDQALRIQERCEDYFREAQIPIAVVLVNTTLELGADQGGPDGIEKGTKLLMTQWREWVVFPDRCVLLVFALLDRVFRIELAPAFTTSELENANKIRKEVMAPLMRDLDAHGNNKERQIAEAILLGLPQILGEPVKRFKRESQRPAILNLFFMQHWYWALLVLHLMGLVYVLCTKDTELWYLLGALFGLGILLSMLLYLLDNERRGVRRSYFLSQDDAATKTDLVARTGFWS